MHFKKTFYKLFKSQKEYNNIKHMLKDEEKIALFEKNYEKLITNIQKNIDKKKELNFFHSGPIGDLIYSLATIKEISKSHKCNFLINLNKKFNHPYHKHPGNGVLINDRMYNFILPFFKSQKYLNSVKKYENEKIDINLDLFRELPWNNAFNTPRVFFHITGEQTNLSEPYAFVEDHPTIKKRIVIQRSFRFRNIYINYKFMKNFESPLFIGMEDEFYDLKEQIPNLELYIPKDYLEIAQIIKSSKFYVGNQSSCFALAEAIKIPRLLEGCPDSPYVQPVGHNAFDFYYQSHFIKWFNYLNKI